MRREKGNPGPKLPPGVMRAKVKVLFEKGHSQREIARILGVAKTTVVFHVRRLDHPPDPRFGRRFDWAEIRDAYDGGLSFRQCRERFGFSADAWAAAVRREDIIPRPRRIPIEELLVAGRRRTARNHLKKRLLQAGLKTNQCEICGLTEWLDQPLSMQLHHVNGDGSDNRLENIEFLCANCHSQTDTYGARKLLRRPKLRLVDPLPAEDSDVRIG